MAITERARFTPLDPYQGRKLRFILLLQLEWASVIAQRAAPLPLQSEHLDNEERDVIMIMKKIRVQSAAAPLARIQG